MKTKLKEVVKQKLAKALNSALDWKEAKRTKEER